MLYEKHFRRLEKIRWHLEDDIDWETINPSLVDKGHVQLIRNICMTEIGSLFAAESFIRDFYDDIDFSCFVSVWYYEEMKHFLVLKRYLSHLGIEFNESELQHLRMSIPISNRETILMVHFLSEHRLATWYQGISDNLREPVGKQIFANIAADEIRHGQAYFDFIQKDLQQHPETLLKYLKAALFMLNPKAPKDLHAVTLTKTTDRLDKPRYILEIEEDLVTEKKKQACTKRIYGLLTLLAKQPIENYKALFKHVTALKQTAHTLASAH